jgi:hypothetical protein
MLLLDVQFFVVIFLINKMEIEANVVDKDFRGGHILTVKLSNQPVLIRICNIGVPCCRFHQQPSRPAKIGYFQLDITKAFGLLCQRLCLIFMLKSKVQLFRKQK